MRHKDEKRAFRHARRSTKGHREAAVLAATAPQATTWTAILSQSSGLDERCERAARLPLAQGSLAAGRRTLLQCRPAAVQTMADSFPCAPLETRER